MSAWARWQPRLPWIGAALVGAWIAVWLAITLRAAWPFTADDAYITLRYATHLAEGDGITWNVGDVPPVEGYSNFSFVVAAAAALRLGLDPVVCVKLLGVVGLLGACAALWHLARGWLGPLGASLPVAVLVSYHGTVFWAASGLETLAYQGLVLGAIAVVVRALPARGEPARPPRDRSVVLGGVLALGAAWTRPEGALVGVTLGAALLAFGVWRTPGAWRARLRPLTIFALVAGVPYAIYFAWRLGTFEAFLPNSAACKAVNGGSSTRLLRDYQELAWLYVAFAVLQPPRRFDPRWLIVAAVPLAYAVILRGVDPIIGNFNRHALAAWALLLVPAAVGLVNVLRLIPRMAPLAAEALAALLVAWWVLASPTARARELENYARLYAVRAADRAATGAWLRAHLAPADAYVIGDCGVIPYVARGRAIDAFCLNNAAAARPPLARDADAQVAHAYAQAPAALVVHSSSPEVLRPRTEYGFYPRLVAHPAFAGYAHAATFGSPGSDFAYWIYVRR